MSLLNTDPVRMACEQRMLAALESEDWFTAGTWSHGREGLEFTFTVHAADKVYDAVLVYPEWFPDVPCFVRPQRSGEFWSVHQYMSGVLCLQWGPDNWHPSVTGADMVRSTVTLLGAERLQQLLPWSPPVPSRHAETAGQQLRVAPRRLVLTQGFFDAIAAAGGLAAAGKLRLEAAVSYLEFHSVLVPLAIGEPKQPVRDVPGEVLRNEFLPRSGWVVAHADAGTKRELASVEALRDALGEQWPWRDGLPDSTEALFLVGPANELRAFTVTAGEQPNLWELKAADYRDKSGERQPPRLMGVGDSTVAIVGVGSVGAKLSVSLCRAGVRRFLLVDDDAIGPDNLVRNELTWRDVAFDKVDSVKRQLELVAAEVKVEVFRTRLAGQENPQVAAKLAQALTTVDLLVDATGSALAFLTAASLCRRAGVAMVWGEIFAGGGGGLIARSRPGKDADPLSIRSHILGVLRTLPAVPALANPRRYEGEVDGQVLSASDADVSALAAAMSQFALDTLTSGTATDFPNAAYLLGFRKFWVFEQPFDTRPIDCSGVSIIGHDPGTPSPEDERALDDLRHQLEASIAARDCSA